MASRLFLGMILLMLLIEIKTFDGWVELEGYLRNYSKRMYKVSKPTIHALCSILRLCTSSTHGSNIRCINCNIFLVQIFLIRTVRPRNEKIKKNRLP